ncbi:MAG: heliorhodopsin HeR, partial [Actinomycetota bacterium]
MNLTIDPEIDKVKRLNLIAGALHLVSMLAILALANDAKLPVNATYLTEAPGTGNFSDPINLFNLKIGYMVAAFLALSAFFHFFIISPSMFGKYTAGLKNHINVFRWVEYSLSSTIMSIVMFQLNGTADYIALMGIAGVNV